MKRIHVPTNDAYDVLVERGILRRSGEILSDLIGSSTCVIISDDNVAPLYSSTAAESLQAAGFRTEQFVFPHGEQSKNADTLMKIYTFLCEKEITRGDCLVALGGGVVGDLTGYAAATYLRGIHYVQIPTSLLAQVDSSVGGKTAIDLPEGKNLVGAFYQPDVVLCDPDTLSTLPQEFLIDGLGEVIKYGMIADAELFETLCGLDLQTIPQHFDDIIPACIGIKRDVVGKDEKESGLRMILNFGHTLGHAIEAYYHYEGITHGCAVAAGMCLITRYCGKAEDWKRLCGCVERYGLPSDVPVPLNELLTFCGHDKKRSGNDLHYVVCDPIGQAKIRRDTISGFRKHFERTVCE